MKLYLMGLFALILIGSCESKKLPFYGEPEVVKKVVDGKETEQSVYPTIPDFSFINEDKEMLPIRILKTKCMWLISFL